MSIEQRNLADTGIKVSILGFGAGLIGDESTSEKQVDKLLNAVLDYGINLIDTARSYGISEERIGKYISKRRREFVLSTKVGYGVEGYEDWTYDCISAGVERALRTLRTDYIDIVHLHSCPLETLKNTGVIEALAKAVEAGKVRVMAYSGENEALEYAVSTDKFKSIMTSINICDQKVIDNIVSKTKRENFAVIAKRPLANIAWKYKKRPYDNYAEEYWLRLEKMNLQFDIAYLELALRFAAFTDGVASCVTGTTSLENIKQNIEILEKGSLPSNILSNIKLAFNTNDDNWVGQI
ncbi:MAG: aldo/keto reductase [Acidobacteria bacterium]|nr:aldo/keto reductase [Acidobacteriota bacterium]